MEDNASTYTFRVDGDLKRNVERVAKANDESLAQLLRKTMRQYLAEHAEVLTKLDNKAK
jgi:predicted transcriptional regulator